MKLDIKLDLEEFHNGEEEYRGESIEESIISTITNRVENQLNIREKMEKVIEDKMESSLNDIIDAWGANFMDAYFDKEIVITDQWGKETFKGSIKDKIHARIDAFIGEKVSENGRVSSYSRDNTYTRIEHITNEIVDNKMKRFTDDTIKKVMSEVEAKLTEELKTAVGKGVVDSIGVNKLLENIKL